MAKIKVFRTPIGFHDAYVAAPSQKAALEAWGADANLFARGVAEVVTDPKLTKAPLERPGEIIRVSRGTADEHAAALPRSKRRAKDVRGEPVKSRTMRSKSRPPSRARLDAVEKSLAQAKEKFEVADADLTSRERRLAEERMKLDRDRARELKRLRRQEEEARGDYQAALDRWQP